MKNIRLLDCTLRDGGYLNDWEFGQNHLVSLYERLVESGVDIIEVGFLDDRRPFDMSRSIMPDTESVAKIWNCTTKRPPMVVGMIDYGTCKIENLQPCEESYLDGIRVIFKKHLMHEAMEFCAQVKKLGYKVFSQLVSITSYNDEDLLELISLVNEVKPYAVSMVDTYGLLHPEDLLHYYAILEEHVCEEVQIGFHAHNNFQLAYANALALIEAGSKHDLVVDGTLHGMGKSAGNAPIELLAMRLNQKYGKNYKISSMLEAIEESIVEFQKTCSWGYKMFYYLVAKNGCHPSYLSYFQAKGNLSISQLDELLGKIEPEEKKLLYDKQIAEKLYEEYITNDCDDSEDYVKLSRDLQGKTILLVGPGKNIQLQGHKVQEYIAKENPYVIAINYVPENVKVHSVFVTKEKRYQQMTTDLHKKMNDNIKLIGTSNVDCVTGNFEYRLNRAPLLEKEERYADNSFLMLLKALKKAGVTEIVCAGFDGYSDREDNYFNPSMEYHFVKDAARYLNSHIRDVVKSMREDMQISFLTYSRYDEMGEEHESAF